MYSQTTSSTRSRINLRLANFVSSHQFQFVCSQFRLITHLCRSHPPAASWLVDPIRSDSISDLPLCNAALLTIHLLCTLSGLYLPHFIMFLLLYFLSNLTPKWAHRLSDPLCAPSKTPSHHGHGLFALCVSLSFFPWSCACAQRITFQMNYTERSQRFLL